jgi:hypothetical protein
LQPFDYSFEITSPEWGNRWYLIVIPNLGSLLRLTPIEGATFLTQEQKIYGAVAIGQILEAVVPLEMLKNPSQVAITALANQYARTNPVAIQLSGRILPAAKTTVNLADSAINPDGKPNDWRNRRAIMIPPSSDRARAAGAEILAVYAFADSKNLYLRLDQSGGFPVPPLRPFDYVFDLTSSEWGNRHYQINIPNSGSSIFLLPIEDAPFLTQEQKIDNAAAMGEVLEAIVPLELLQDAKLVTLTVSVEGIAKLGPIAVPLRP